MITLMNLPIRRGNAPLRIARGHFATNHSHINYFVDITYQKTRLSEAKDSAHQLVSHFINDTPVDTILCLDGTAVLGTCLAEADEKRLPDHQRPPDHLRSGAGIQRQLPDHFPGQYPQDDHRQARSGADGLRYHRLYGQAFP